MKKKVTFFLMFVFLGTMLAACGSDQEATTLREEPYFQEEFLLGTYTRIRIYDEGKEDAMKPEGFR